MSIPVPPSYTLGAPWQLGNTIKNKLGQQHVNDALVQRQFFPLCCSSVLTTIIHILLDGTHVAATIGGKSFGVAKKTTLNCIKVLDDEGRGSTSSIISGINLAIQQALNSTKPSVISMSISSPIDQAVDEAVHILPITRVAHSLKWIP